MNLVLFLLLVVAEKPHTVDLVQGHVEAQGEAWVGQKVTVVVKLYSPTFFAGAPTFDLPAVPGVVILPPQDPPLVGTEVIGGDSYTTQTHDLAVYAQRPGTIHLPRIGVRFTSDGGIGKPPVPHAGKTKELVFTATLPPGAEGLSTVITTSKLTIHEHWKPEPGKAKPGGAFTRTVTVRAVNVPGMVLPPIRWEAPAGIGVYPARATVTDSSEPDGMTGQRVDSVTYVCEKPGTYRLPGITLAWWDTDQKKLRREQLPTRTIEVESVLPSGDSGESEPHRKLSGLAWAMGGVIVAAGLGLALWLFYKPPGHWLADRRAARADGEAAWFSKVKAACRKDDPRRIEQALLAWLDHIPDEGRPWRLSDLAEHSPDLMLKAQLANLQAQLYGTTGPSVDWSANKLLEAVKAARKRWLVERNKARPTSELPQLNQVLVRLDPNGH